MSLWWVAAVMVATLAASVPFVLGRMHESTNAFICDRCGVRLWIISGELAGKSTAVHEERTLEHTALSRWIATHVSTNCLHTWAFNHSASQTYATLSGIRLWKIVGSSGSAPTPSLVYFSAADQACLENLLSQSRDECQRYIQARLQGKEGIHE